MIGHGANYLDCVYRLEWFRLQSELTLVKRTGLAMGNMVAVLETSSCRKCYSKLLRGPCDKPLRRYQTSNKCLLYHRLIAQLCSVRYTAISYDSQQISHTVCLTDTSSDMLEYRVVLPPREDPCDRALNAKLCCK